MKFILTVLTIFVMCSCKTRSEEEGKLAGSNNKYQKRTQKSQSMAIKELVDFASKAKNPIDNCKIAFVDISKSENSATLVFFDQKGQYRRDFSIKNPKMSLVKKVPGFDRDIQYGLITVDNTSFMDKALGHRLEKILYLYINTKTKAIEGLTVRFPSSDNKAKSQTCGYKPEVLK